MNLILIVDAAINLVLGVILLAFLPDIVALFGIPDSHTRFYPNILGAVFMGITIAQLTGSLFSGKHKKKAVRFRTASLFYR